MKYKLGELVTVTFDSGIKLNGVVISQNIDKITNKPEYLIKTNDDSQN